MRISQLEFNIQLISNIGHWWLTCQCHKCWVCFSTVRCVHKDGSSGLMTAH